MICIIFSLLLNFLARSPDGLLIAFDTGPDTEWEVWIINADGTNLRQVTDSPSGVTAINPVWKPII